MSDDETIHTSIEVDAPLWRELRAEAIETDRDVASQLEVVLQERYRNVRADGGDSR